MKTKLVFFLLVASFIASHSIAVETYKGAPIIEIHGGGLGNISFPHQEHQNALGDCSPCHKLFPQEPGSIEKLKTEGKLKKKQVMEQCRNCHKETAAKGEKAGPVNCKDCHKR